MSSSSSPTWPKFDTSTNRFMELRNIDSKVITTPNKERIEKVLNTIFKARIAQVISNVAPGKKAGSH